MYEKIILDTSQRNLWYPIEENACLKITMEIMVQHNIHRVPIVDGEGNILFLEYKKYF